MPVWGTSSPTADGARRRFTSTGALVQEVGDARVWGGIHYRNATDVGARRGREVGELAAPWLGAAL